MKDGQTSAGARKIGGAFVLPKVCGCDVELGNYIQGSDVSGGTSYYASRILLSEIEGYPGNDNGYRRDLFLPDSWSRGSHSSYGWSSQDWGRKFLAENGGCCYIDLNHLEVCNPETLSAFDYVACRHAMLHIVRGALDRANARMPAGTRVVANANNSDGLGNSYGSHENYMVTRQCWDNIFSHRMHYLLFLASFLASSLVYTGAGKVGSESGAPRANYQLSQRADFIETLHGQQTTYNRPIVNSRDEALAEGAAPGDPARLHVIFYDNTLCPTANLLRVGVTQIVLAMIEQGCVDPTLMVDHPVQAVTAWSHDPTLRHAEPLATGKRHTALELQFRFLERAAEFVGAGHAEGLVPHAREILELWEDTLARLDRRDFETLSRRLDWVLKWTILEQAFDEYGLGWESPEAKYLDHMYSSLDTTDGLFWPYLDQGLVDRVVEDSRVLHFAANPPEDTRAYTRAMLLRMGGERATLVDWHRMRFRRNTVYHMLPLGHPLNHGKAQTAAILGDGDRSFEEKLLALGAAEGDGWSIISSSTSRRSGSAAYGTYA